MVKLLLIFPQLYVLTIMKTLIKGYEERFGRAVIYIAFVLVSLLAAAVLFGLLESTGILELAFETYVKQANFGGATTIFLVTLIFLVTRLDNEKTRLLTGNVYNDNNIPVENAEIHIDGINGTVRTNHTGFFEFKVSPFPRYILHVTYGAITAQKSIDSQQANKPIILKLSNVNPQKKSQPKQDQGN
jgi:hypothetical protein